MQLNRDVIKKDRYEALREKYEQCKDFADDLLSFVMQNDKELFDKYINDRYEVKKNDKS